MLVPWHLQSTVSPSARLLLLFQRQMQLFSHALHAETFRSSSATCQIAGEVFVLDDGGEADLDLGNYERYLDVTLSKDNNITTGKIYRDVIEKEVRLVMLWQKTLANAYLHVAPRRLSWKDSADHSSCHRSHSRLD